MTITKKLMITKLTTTIITNVCVDNKTIIIIKRHPYTEMPPMS
jgi:hypothetical protein